jgi:hypothetical protein
MKSMWVDWGQVKYSHHKQYLLSDKSTQLPISVYWGESAASVAAALVDSWGDSLKRRTPTEL